jgi:transketolase
MNRDRRAEQPCIVLVYSVLHLTGYQLPIEELKNFRQFGSKTPT